MIIIIIVIIIIIIIIIIMIYYYFYYYYYYYYHYYVGQGAPGEDERACLQSKALQTFICNNLCMILVAAWECLVKLLQTFSRNY